MPEPDLARSYTRWSPITPALAAGPRGAPVTPLPVTRRAHAPVAAWLAFVGLLLTAAPTAAHAELSSSTPAANGSVRESPAALELAFSEAIDPATASVRLIDAQQRSVAGGDAPVVAGAVVSLALPNLAAGVYTVEYRVVSAVDGHQTSGLFAFAVDPTGANPPPAVPAQSSAPATDGAAVASRWVALGGGVVLLGVALFWLVSVRPALGAPRRTPSAPFALLAGAAAAALTGTATYLALAARGLGTMPDGAPGGGGLPFDVAAPFGATPFANAMRVALAAALVALVVAVMAAIDGATRRRRQRPPRPDALPLLAITAAGAILLAAFSMAGHASSLGGSANGIVDAFHLVAVAAWIGALPGLAALAAAARGRDGRAALVSALRRHGRVALAAAPMVAITGLVNVPAVIGPARGLVASGYGNLVIAKALLFSMAVAIGAANWWLLRGRGARAGLVLIGAEAMVGAVAILVAATMVSVPPTAGRGPVAAPAGLGAAQLYGTAGETIVHLAIIRPLPGMQRYEVVTRDASDGTPRTGVQKVFLTFVAPVDAGVPDQRVALAPSDQAWLWATGGAYTPVVGDWRVEVTVRRAGIRDEAVAFALRVGDAVPPATVARPDDGLRAPAPLQTLWRAVPGGLPGAVVAALALAAGGLLARARRGRPAAAVLLAVGLLAGLSVASRTLVDVANAAPASRAAAANPVPADAASLARGDAVYRANCSSCHGASGEGDGPAATAALPGLPDALGARSDGELAWIIERGVAGTQMPAFALTLSEQDRWDLINRLRAMSGAAAP